MTETIPVPWDKPKTQLPSTEAGAIQLARSITDTLLSDDFDADPMEIKKRVNVGINYCDAKDWKAARDEFVFGALGCERQWTLQNPRGEHGGDRKSSSAPELDPSPIPGATRTALHDTYEGVTADEMRAAKATADAMGETVTRGHVQREVEAPADGVQRRAKASAQRAKAKREAAMEDKQAIMQDALEGTAARAHAAEAELATRNADEETLDDAVEEMATANANLAQMTEIQAKQIADLREKLKVSEGQVAYWKEYANKIEAALQRGDAGG